MGEIVVRMDPKQLSVGPQLKQVLVGQEGSDAHSVVVPIKLTLVQPQKPRTSELSLRSIEYGRQSATAIAAADTTVLLTVPNDGPADGAKADVSVDAPPSFAVQVLSDESSTGEGGPDRRLTYSVAWTNPPAAGEFRHVIRWTVTPPGKPPATLELPLTGEAYVTQ